MARQEMKETEIGNKLKIGLNLVTEQQAARLGQWSRLAKREMEGENSVDSNVNANQEEASWSQNQGAFVERAYQRRAEERRNQNGRKWSSLVFVNSDRKTEGTPTKQGEGIRRSSM